MVYNFKRIFLLYNATSRGESGGRCNQVPQYDLTNASCFLLTLVMEIASTQRRIGPCHSYKSSRHQSHLKIPDKGSDLKLYGGKWKRKSDAIIHMKEISASKWVFQEKSKLRIY